MWKNDWNSDENAKGNYGDNSDAENENIFCEDWKIWEIQWEYYWWQNWVDSLQEINGVWQRW